MRKLILAAGIFLSFLACVTPGLSQETADLELSLDITSATVPLPGIFKPNLDLSGRGFHQESTWPQALAAKESIEAWGKEIGFNGFYRLQYNLWDITQLLDDKDAQAKLLANYEGVIKSVSDGGGTVILNIFGTPAGMGEILDKKSAPVNIPAYKELIRAMIKDLSCEKKYNIWYEVWNAPDLEDFFLGRHQEYLNLYRAVSESVKELEAEYKINIPLGGPSSSWWFRNLEGNNVLSPEKSLIYELIKFCYNKHLDLDFISWHGFSSDPKAEKEITIYNKNAVYLVRDWLSYFNFKKDMPLIIDEWNYDRDANFLPARREKSYISASYIPSRIKNMHEAGIDNQVYFSLEDFQNNKERVTRNTGVFSLDPGRSEHKNGPKANYNVFKMLRELGQEMFALKLSDEFAGALATKSGDKLAILIYNYIDPEIARGFLSAHISGLNPVERKFLLSIIRSEQLIKIMAQGEDITALRTTNKVKSLLNKARELDIKAKQFAAASRSIKINLKNIQGEFFYRCFTVDSSCALNCEFKPAEEKEIIAAGAYEENLSLSPYSVNLIVLNKKPALPKDADATGK